VTKTGGAKDYPDDTDSLLDGLTDLFYVLLLLMLSCLKESMSMSMSMSYIKTEMGISGSVI